MGSGPFFRALRCRKGPWPLFRPLLRGNGRIRGSMHGMRLLLICAGWALLLSAPPPVDADSPAQSDADMAERLAACAGCHGEAGRSDSERYFPSIAGKPAGYLESQLHNFRDGRRRHTIMESMLALMSDEYLQAIAAYYARQEPKWTPPETGWSRQALARGRQLVERGDPERDLPSCRSCHGDALKGVAQI